MFFKIHFEIFLEKGKNKGKELTVIFLFAFFKFLYLLQFHLIKLTFIRRCYILKCYFFDVIIAFEQLQIEGLLRDIIQYHSKLYSISTNYTNSSLPFLLLLLFCNGEKSTYLIEFVFYYYFYYCFVMMKYQHNKHIMILIF
ncbi:hypothetical protein RFI_16700 [Reticulomyxa filosa]|uniref:Transmembrane protein n=1 Tax=Reticulomyxa filosa TaxID=46433 RepID=X6N3N4_RETFI|nr:hypothetical protein RFI_16700 [Reticulomyxa filosa]|eukprot:ETO20518.1 hypothetical protein RFI_16700 [Reticulomyxa filosa]